MRCMSAAALFVLCALMPRVACGQSAANLLPDPSVELTKPKDQFGAPFARWAGWVFEGACELRIGRVARTGRTSAEMFGAQGGKLRVYTPTVTLEPGRYRFSAYLRGLDVGPGQWGTMEDLCFGDDTYHPLKLAGTFGWTRVELVVEIAKPTEAQGRVGLWGPGRLWVDDAEIVRVGPETALTSAPVVGAPEAPIAPPDALDPAGVVRCPECGYRSMPAWGRCYACGGELARGAGPAAGPDVRALADFEQGTTAPFTPGANLRTAPASHGGGRAALRLDRGFAAWDGAQDWSGYDYLRMDTRNPTGRPIQLYFEARDAGTTDYWTRVNYWTVMPPGASTITIPTDLYVGEKSRPGRRLDLRRITRVVLNLGDEAGPVLFDNLRLERDRSDSVAVPGLQAFSFGPGTSPPMRGFTPITPSTLYSPARGFGFIEARIWRAFDMMQPDPLYQYGICVQAGRFGVDLPDGRYHVFINLDSPSGFWGEFQVFTRRVLRANGAVMAEDRVDFAGFLRRYYRFADTEDAPGESAFDKYQRAYFHEKEFDVEVRGGRLELGFEGENWANFVSALVIYPAAEAAAGQRYLANLTERRRFAFENYFKRILPDATRDALGPIPAFTPTAGERAAGLVLFARDWMVDTPANAVPRRSEVTRRLRLFAAAGSMEPIVFSALPLRSLGAVRVAVSDLMGPGGARIPAAAVRPGVVSHRLTRVTPEGTVYTIAPRLILPRAAAVLRTRVVTTFWLTLHAPAKAPPGLYRGRLRLRLASGRTETLEIEARLFARPLDPLEIPAGPWGCTVDLPWPGPEAEARNWSMLRRSLAKLREYGATACSGIPTLQIRGWKDGKPEIDFARADREMAEARAAGFKMTVNYNGGLRGFDNYLVDEAAMRAAGFSGYTDFLRAALAPVAEHARAAGWLPFAFNLCDEPLGDALPRAAANARAWRDALPPGLLTTGATSMTAPKAGDPHLALASALRIANLNDHDSAGIAALHAGGSDWAFYNGGSRWTFGTYMYKCVRELGMKFRLSWHWNASAGDPYYALDCREDDYAWCTANAAGELIPTVHFDRDIRAGIDDYRAMQTLDRLARIRPDRPAAAAARALLAKRLAAFRPGQRDHNALWPVGEYRAWRLRLLEAIERLGGR